jgi:hypothetical protein
MPKNQACDLITDQEMAFARLILGGTMTDRRAAEAAGLNPDTASCTKAKPRVRSYMLEQRAAMQQRLLEQEADLSRLPPACRGSCRGRIAAQEPVAPTNPRSSREIAALPAEVTRGSITGQVKAISMIIAIEGLIPDRRAVTVPRNPVPAHAGPDIHDTWLDEQQTTTVDSQPCPPTQQEDEPDVREPNPAPGPVGDPLPDPVASPSTFANAPEPYLPHSAAVPDKRVPFFIPKNRFGRRR